MRIAYLCSSTSWGGLELNHLKNAQWMQQRGHAVWVFAPAEAPLFERAKALDLKVIPFHKQPKYVAWRTALNLVKQLRACQITHVFIRDNRDMSLLASIKFLSGKRITTCYFMEMQLGVSKRGLLHTLRYTWVDGWFCPLHGLVDQVRSLTRINLEKIHYLPSGIDFSGIKKIPKSEARLALDLPTEGFVFGLIGRFDRQKGQLLALEALHQLHQPSFSIVFLGEPTKNEQEDISGLIQQKIDDFALHDRVYLRPFMQEVSGFYSAIDALIMATKAETFGMVTLEALSYELPVVGSNAGGTPELLGFGKFGELFESLNSQDLARAMTQRVSSPREMDASSLREHLKKFDHHRVCKALEDYLQKDHG